MLSTNYFVIYSAKGEQIEDFFRNCQDDGTWIVYDLLARDNFVIIIDKSFLHILCLYYILEVFFFFFFF
jgi:hypothetical protein